MTRMPNARDGFLLLDGALNPILINRAAAEILCYPQTSGIQANSTAHIVRKLRESLALTDAMPELDAISQFRSGRRQYISRIFHVDAVGGGIPSARFAVILERAAAGPPTLVEVSRMFHLTDREEQVAHLLLQGLTSKEIGSRLGISPNTVKAFLRSIMMKMGVSTRSGIVGKALTPRLSGLGTLVSQTDRKSNENDLALLQPMRAL